MTTEQLKQAELEAVKWIMDHLPDANTIEKARDWMHYHGYRAAYIDAYKSAWHTARADGLIAGAMACAARIARQGGDRHELYEHICNNVAISVEAQNAKAEAK